MEQFPQEDYLETHRAALVGLLDSADALALYRDPAVQLGGSGREISLDRARVEGLSLDSYDAATEVGKRAAAEISMAKVDLNGFRTAVSASLAMTYIDNHPEAFHDAQPSEVLRQSTHEIGQVAMHAVFAAEADYARSDFMDDDTGNGFIIRMMHVRRPDGSLLARELALTVTDGLVDRVLTLLELDGVLDVRQDIDPTENEVVRALTEFFVGEHHDEQGLQAVMSLYWAQALGDPAADLSEVYARYPGAAERATIDTIVAQLHAQAEAVRRGMQLGLASPELMLPSDAELDAYAELIAAAR